MTIGQNIGKYRIVDKIGRGGMGTVYRAVDETLHREVAIKVLNAELNDPEVAKRFRAEAITVARLSHPGIATIYELFEYDGQWLMVMEFVRGETLENMVARMGALSAQRGAELCMQTLAALAHAHSMGVVHRDLKPANLMITESGTVKVMDFGIARVSGSEHLTNAGFMMGTPAYMAPEQVRGGEVDARADLYAMGVVFYRLTTSKLPFKGDTAFAMVQSQVNDMPTPVGTIRADLAGWVDDVISRALAKAPEERFQSAAEFHEAFARCLAGLPLSSMYSATGDILMTPPRPMPTPSGAYQMRSAGTPSAPFPILTGSHPTQIAPGTNPGGISSATDETVLTPAAGGTLRHQHFGTGAQQQPAGWSSGAQPAPVQVTPAQGSPATGAVAEGAKGKKSSTGLLVGIGAVVVIGAIAVAATMMSGGGQQPPAEQQATQTDPAAIPTPTIDPAVAAGATPAPSPALTPTPAVTPVISPGATGVTPPAGRTTGAGTAGLPGASTSVTGGTGARGATPVPTPTPTATPTATPTPSTTPGARAGVPPPPATDALATFPNVRLYTVVDKRTNNREVIVNFVGGQVLVMPRTGGDAIATVPYSRIKGATYTRGRDPKWDPTLPGPEGIDVGTVFRGASHWLVVQGAESYAVIRMDDRNFGQIIETLQARTGITVVRHK